VAHCYSRSSHSHSASLVAMAGQCWEAGRHFSEHCGEQRWVLKSPAYQLHIQHTCLTTRQLILHSLWRHRRPLNLKSTAELNILLDTLQVILETILPANCHWYKTPGQPLKSQPISWLISTKLNITTSKNNTTNLNNRTRKLPVYAQTTANGLVQPIFLDKEGEMLPMPDYTAYCCHELVCVL